LKPNINAVDAHPHLNQSLMSIQWMDVALVGAGSLSGSKS
jgi:hypothetical protein